MSRSRSLLHILSDPQLIQKHDKKKILNVDRSAEKQISQTKIHSVTKIDEKNELSLSDLSSQEAKQIEQFRKNQSQLYKNMSEYEQLQLLKLQKQILSYGSDQIQISPTEKMNHTLNEETSFQIQKKNPNLQPKNNKIYVYPKDQQPSSHLHKINTSELNQTIQVNQNVGFDNKKRQVRSITEYNEKENPWPGKFPLYSKNIDKINLSCLYLKFKQDLINKKDEYLNVINNNKTLTSPERVLNQLSQSPQLTQINSQKRASTCQDLPPLKNQLKDPYNTIAQFNLNSRKIGIAEFQSDFSHQQNIQQQRASNLQRNLYNQLIQQKLKLNSERMITNKQDDQKELDRKRQQREENKAKLQIYNLLPQLLKSKQQEIQEAKNIQNVDQRKSLSPSQSEERIKKINKIMSMKIKKNKNLKQSQSLQHLDQNNNSIYHIGNQLKVLDKSKNIGQYIDQLKTLNENIKKELQHQLKLNQPSLKKNQKYNQSNENIVKYLNKSDYPFYNLTYFKIDQFSNQLQKIHKNPQYTLHQELDQNLQPINSPDNSHLPSIVQQYTNYQTREQNSLKDKNSIQTKNKPHEEYNGLPQKQKARGRQASLEKYRSQNQKIHSDQGSQEKQSQIQADQNDSSGGVTKQNFQKNKNEFHQNQQNTLNNNEKQFNTNDSIHHSNNDLNYEKQKYEEIIPQKLQNGQQQNNSFGKSNQQENNDQNKYFSNNKRYYTEQSQLNDSKLSEDFGSNQLDSSIQKQNERDLDKSQSSQMSQVELFSNKKTKAQLYDYLSQTKNQIRFATDIDQVIEEEDLSFDQLKSKKFNGEYNDQLYQDQFVKNFFKKSQKNTVNNSILSNRSYNLI